MITGYTLQKSTPNALIRITVGGLFDDYLLCL